MLRRLSERLGQVTLLELAVVLWFLFPFWLIAYIGLIWFFTVVYPVGYNPYQM